MVKLYYCRIPDEVDEEIIPFLSEYRKNKLARTTSLKLRRQGICAELLLEKAAQNIYKRPLPLLTDSNGKPYFDGGVLHFNISHSGDWVACAVAENEIGLDIQTEAEYKAELCKRFFYIDEQKYILEAENKNSAFTEIWCKKEAKLKESGLGLKAGLASFSVLENEMDFAYGKIAQLHYAVCAGDINKTKIILEEVKLL